MQVDWAIGVDIGGTKMAAGRVSSDGVLIGAPISCATPAQDGPQAMLAALANLVKQLASPTDQALAARPLAIGVGTAGVVDDQGRIISSTDAIRDWAGTDVIAGLRAELARWQPELAALPIFVDNDVNAYALGELWQGAAKHAKSALLVAVGTGVGGAVVVNGSVWHGAHFVAGEIGHLPAPGGFSEICTCGRPGHLEAVVAGPQILKRYLAAGGSQQVSDTRELAKYIDSDPIAARVFNESGSVLGRALAGLVTSLDPEIVVISGGIVAVGAAWLEPLRESFAAEIIAPLRGVTIEPALLGTTAPIIGAAYGAFRASW